jgi:hypothetical protein
MAAAGLKPTALAGRVDPRRAPTRRLRAGRLGSCLDAYAAIWTATLTAAFVVALAWQTLARPVQQLLGLRLTPYTNPPPDIERVMALAAHNIPIAAWPLLLGVMGAHRSPRGRRIADCLVLACIVANILPVGAALGAYGVALLPYIPQVPLEWAGLALGAGSWLVQRQSPLTAGEGWRWFALISVVLVAAAALETFAVPHRSGDAPAGPDRLRPVASPSSASPDRGWSIGHPHTQQPLTLHQLGTMRQDGERNEGIGARERPKSACTVPTTVSSMSAPQPAAAQCCESRLQRRNGRSLSRRKSAGLI